MKTQQHKQSGYDRNQYGALICGSSNTQINFINGNKLLEKAISTGKLPDEFIDTNKKGYGECLNYDIYDVMRGVVLVQRRITVMDKYGNHPQKDYFIIKSDGNQVIVNEAAHKSMILKWSKRAKKLGDIIKADAGIIKIDMSLKTEIGYKAVTKNDSGHYISVWDKSSWKLGVQRVEKATKNHTGGFYYYPTIEKCRKAALDNDIFGDARDHKNLFIISVKIEGARYNIYDYKYCASKLTPIKLISSI